MLKIRHGGILELNPDQIVKPMDVVVSNATKDSTALANADELSTEDRDIYSTWPFGYMFPELQDDKYLLEKFSKTVKDLRGLGAAMGDPGPDTIPGVPVPAIYTFFGQFVDHDITLERGSANIGLADPAPLDLDQVTKHIINSRSPNLDLDNVYGPNLYGQMSPRDPDNPHKMRIGPVAPTNGLPRGKDKWNDLPRLENGTALIGDPRDDENIITAQLHVAFLRAHNAAVDRGLRFDQARKLIIQHYQWIVLDDFLERIADPNIVKRVRYSGAKFFNPPPRSFFMPLEFSGAAFRYGHSKVRASYDRFNDKNKGGGLDLLFNFIGRALPDDWIIAWPSFLDSENPRRFSRRIDTSLSKKLLKLGSDQVTGDPEQNLAVRNLLRGYILRLPTGQAVAEAMASQGIRPMTEEQIASVASDIPGQYEVLVKTDFLKKTPLWFYILAEAAYYSSGYHLGPVGSTIVAEVLIGVLRNSSYSILSDPQWGPTLGDIPCKFDLEDLLKLAGVF